MKKHLIFLVCLSMLFISCGKDEDESSSTSGIISEADVASFASSGAGMAQSMTNSALAYESTPPSIAALSLFEAFTKNRAPKAASYSFNSSNNYWEATESVTSSSEGTTMNVSSDFSIGLWEGGSLTQTVVSALEQVTMFGTSSIAMSNSNTGESLTFTMTMGNGISSPLTWEGIDTDSVTMNGSFSFDITSAGQSVEMAMTFTDLTIDTASSNFPSGTMSITASSSGQSFSGTIVYDGTSTAVATIDGVTVDVDLSASITSILQ